MARPRSFSNEELQKVINDHPDWNLSQLGDHFDVTGEYIRFVIKHNNLNYVSAYHSTKHLLPSQVQSVIDNHPDWTTSDLAKYLNVTRSPLHAFIRRHGLVYKSKNCKYTPEKCAEIQKIIDDNPDMNQRMIAEKLGIPKGSFEYLVREGKVKYHRTLKGGNSL